MLNHTKHWVFDGGPSGISVDRGCPLAPRIFGLLVHHHSETIHSQRVVHSESIITCSMGKPENQHIQHLSHICRHFFPLL